MNPLLILGNLFRPRPALDAEMRAAIERIVDLVDPTLRLSGDYLHKLELPVQKAIGYCEDLVGRLPGPIEVNRRSFGNDPLVHALFATADDITRTLGESQAVRDFLATPASYETEAFYVLLAARRCTKRILGYAVKGDGLVADVPQDLLYFTAHTLIEPNSGLEAIRHSLRTAALESMAKSFSTHVAALRQERMGLLGDRRVAQAGIGNLRGQAKGEVCALNTRRIEELDARLHAALELLLPENVLDALASSLGQPEQLLRLESVELAVDRAGVLLEPAASGTSLDAKPIEFLELTSRDRRRHVAVLVRVQRADAASSVVAAEARRDRFLII